MLRLGLYLSALVVAVWLVAIVWVASTDAYAAVGIGGGTVGAYTYFAFWALAFVWLGVGLGSLTRRAVRYFAKPS